MADFTFAPLSPVVFLDRSRQAFADRIAIVDGERRYTYAEFADRCDRLSNALSEAGITSGRRVAALCVNSHVMLELHHAVPRRGAVLVSLNVRLAEAEMAYILEHSGASMIVATVEFAEAAARLAEAAGLTVHIAGGAADTT